MQLNQCFKKQNMKKRNLSAKRKIHNFYLFFLLVFFYSPHHPYHHYIHSIHLLGKFFIGWVIFAHFKAGLLFNFCPSPYLLRRFYFILVIVLVYPIEYMVEILSHVIPMILPNGSYIVANKSPSIVTDMKPQLSDPNWSFRICYGIIQIIS